MPIVTLKRTLLVCLITSLTLPGNPVVAASPESRLAKKYEAYFKQQIQEEKIPGAAL